MEALRRHYFWYLHELHFELPSIDRMQRSHGFCRRHTKYLLAVGPASTIGRVYNWMLPPFLARLRAAERGAPPLPDVLPSARCDACETETRAVDGKLRQLQLALQHPEVQEALEQSPTVCLVHVNAIAGALSWDQLRHLTGSVSAWLMREAQSGDWPRWLRLVRGDDLDALSRRPAERRAASAEDVRPGSSRACDDACWSPSLHHVHELMAQGGCPVCRARRSVLVEYFEWLAVEAGGRHSDWGDAIWLCRTHAWDFASIAHEDAVHRLADGAAAHWRGQLRALADGLAYRPADNPLARLKEIPGRIAARHASAQWWRWLSPADHWPAFRASLQSPRSRLDCMREIILRGHACPACRAQQTVAGRTLELLVRGLADADTARAYEQSTGICFRDLTLALRLCSDSAERRLLARVERVRLEVLQWELEENQRKEAWQVRYEPKSGEASAWRRVVTQFSGSCLDDPTLVGLG